MSQKGSSFERDICKQLSYWWTDGERSDVFWRTQTSGARATTRAKQGKKTFGQNGDVQACDPLGQPLLDLVSIEIKRGYSKSSFADMVEAPEKAAIQQYDKFIAQAIQDAKKAEVPYWWLITKRDRKETWITMPYDFWACLELSGVKIYPSIRLYYLSKALQRKIRVVLMPFTLFLKRTSSEELSVGSIV